MVARRYAVAWVALTASVSLLAGYALKAPCVFEPWLDFHQYRSYCYSDIIPLYGLRGLAAGQIPYVEAFNEYPVLSGLVQYAAASFTSSMAGYFLANAVVLLVAGWAATVALWRSGLSMPRILAFSASPALLVHALTNWDLLAVAFAVWGWVRWREGDAFGSALLFGLGGAAKLYPAFFLPFLLLAPLRRRDSPAATRVLGGGVLGFGVPNLVVAVWDFDGWLATWTFHGDRFPDFETPWGVLFEVDEGLRTVTAVATAGAMLVATSLLALGQWRGRVDPLWAGTIVVAVFLLVNRVYSPQYTLWVLPLVLLAGARPTLVWAFVAADLGVFLARYPRFTPPAGATDGWDPAWETPHEVFILARWVLLLVVVALMVWDWGRAAHGRDDAS